MPPSFGIIVDAGNGRQSDETEGDGQYGGKDGKPWFEGDGYAEIGGEHCARH